MGRVRGAAERVAVGEAAPARVRRLRVAAHAVAGVALQLLAQQRGLLLRGLRVRARLGERLELDDARVLLGELAAQPLLLRLPAQKAEPRRRCERKLEVLGEGGRESTRVRALSLARALRSVQTQRI